MLKYFQYYVILRDYLHKKLHFEKGNRFLHTFVLSAVRLLVPLAMLASGILTIICMAYGSIILGTLFAITFVGLIYGVQKQQVWMNELLLCIGIPITAVNGFSAFIRTILYNKPYEPIGDLSTIIATLLLFVVGILVVMTANSGNFDMEVTNPNHDNYDDI